MVIILRFLMIHHIQSIRNNLLTKNIQFNWRGKEQIASWKHLVNLYDMDKTYENLEMRNLSKITEGPCLQGRN